MANLKQQAAIEALDALDTRDPEVAHMKADDILMDYVPPAVRAAYERVGARSRWWAYA